MNAAAVYTRGMVLGGLRYSMQQRYRTANWVQRQRYRRWNGFIPETPDDLVSMHFRTWSVPAHINEWGLRLAIRELGGRPAFIVETGTSAWGTDSTRLWDGYVRRWGGGFWTVDLARERSERLKGQVGDSTRMVIDDSVEFIERWVTDSPGRRLDLAYLDSWDVNWATPDAAALHGLREWRAIQPAVHPGTVVVIDDTPSSIDHIPVQFHKEAQRWVAEKGALPGKGSLVLTQSDFTENWQVLHHDYNLVCRRR